MGKERSRTWRWASPSSEKAVSTPWGNQDTEGPQAGQPYHRAINALRTYRKRQLEEKLHLVGLCDDSGLIFTTQSGTPVYPENLVRRSLNPLLSRANMPDIRFHDLRHACTTLLLGRGVYPKLVQERLVTPP